MTAEQRELFEKLPYLEQDEYFDIHGYKVRNEIFPGTSILGINNKHKAENLWWTIADKTWDGKPVKLINAKSETVDRVPMFKEAFRTDRILIPATGFFEWDPGKQKHLFTFDEPLFMLGGIARTCEIKGEPTRCAAILTTEANNIVRPIHVKNRMPVVLHQYDYDKWLDVDTPIGELRQMMLPFGDAETHVSPEDT
ncbi:hypothetical protein BH10ACI3_BH10ACI3_28340 [soil metagenome]